ncbi:MAG: serine hydrolase [Ignavibacteriales bacterium]|nr:serine hydrolase [Ignavibacteriales bacterium]
MLKSAPAVLLFVLYVFLAQQPGDNFNTQSFSHLHPFSLLMRDGIDGRVENRISTMSEQEMLAQLVFPVLNIRKYYDDADYAQKIDALIETGIGGLLLSPADPQLTRRFTAEHPGNTRYPLMYCADLENGLYSKENFSLHLQPLMAWGAMNDSMATYQSAAVIAQLARYLGIHFNLSPVADLNTNPDNSVISVRSFGDNPYIVSKQIAAYVKAMNDNNILACIKHFPGHGNTAVDSHYGLPVVERTTTDLWSLDLVPFREMVHVGKSAIMTGHIALPFIDSSGLPASLSRTLVNGVLREKLGFQGVVISDALNMQAVQKDYSDSAAALLAFNAGTDILLYPENAAVTIRSLRNSFQAGYIKREMIVESVRRILTFKASIGLLDGNSNNSDAQSLAELERKFHSTDSIIAENSATLVKDEHKLLQKLGKPHQKIRHITFYDSSLEHVAVRHHAGLKEKLGFENAMLIENRLLKKREKLKIKPPVKGEIVVVSAFLRHSDYEKETNKKSTLYGLKRFMSQSRQNIVLSFRNPFLNRLFGLHDSYINFYGFSNAATETAARIFKGKHVFTGVSPVVIAGTNSVKQFKTPETDRIPAENLTGKLHFEDVDGIFEKAITDSVFPGAVALVSIDGKVVFEKAYGRYTYKKDAPLVKKNTIFDLASVSKVIATTTAVMILVSEGKLQLDRTVVSYLQEFGNNGKENITLRNLLLHNSGLPAFKRFYLSCKNENEVLKEIFTSELTFSTGTKTVYSDLGMITVGKIIEKVTGKTLDVFCKERIFNPLIMKSTFYNPVALGKKYDCMPTELDMYWRKKLLQGEVHDEAAAMLHGVAGHAGLFSTAADISQLLHMLLMKGYAGSKQLIRPEIVTMFTAKQAEGSSRGLGWDTKTDNAASAGSIISIGSFGHTGYTGTSVWVDQKRGVCIILLTNRVYPTRNNTKLTAFRPLFHDTVMRDILKK